ncbi:hypothetical protein D0T12_30290 [Actinomadura spongiicola]|uniref:Uncharacterized protein n=1 Tax=Actinomadura spongiicola TaxID=2303421 RepID=A0A372GA22_9ACTN|nr:DUF6059 family protein [Actinomadura spongiicola]RFS81989.1 hypothetical protein D0T12_30290 [Actinomadura spongiicola]
MAKNRRRIKVFLGHLMEEIGYVCGVLLGHPMPRTKRSASRGATPELTAPPSGHPERVSAEPPTAEEEHLWRQLDGLLRD